LLELGGHWRARKEDVGKAYLKGEEVSIEETGGKNSYPDIFRVGAGCELCSWASKKSDSKKEEAVGALGALVKIDEHGKTQKRRSP